MKYKVTTEIGIKTSFVAYHRWIKAPDEVAFLRGYHRHVFNVTVQIPVTNLDRELEFFMVRKRIDEFLVARFTDAYFEGSCEAIALEIANFSMELFNLFRVQVTVQEDTENYATLQITREEE